MRTWKLSDWSRSLLPLGFACLLSCGGSAQHRRNMPAAGQRSDKLVLVTVASARIGPRAPGGDTWDTADAHDQEKRTVESLASVLQLVPQVAALGTVVKVLGPLVPAQETGASAAYPDPVVQVTFNEPVSTRVARSPLIVNSVMPAWDYAFYVRVDGLREAGLDVVVLDDDDESVTKLGGVTLSRKDLEAVASSGTAATLRLANGSIEELIVRVEPVLPAASSVVRRVHLELSAGMVGTDVRVPKGALVSVRTTGDGAVGSYVCEDVTPAGLTTEKCKEYNLGANTTTLDAPHGSALAFIGVAPNLEAISLVSDPEESEQCVRFIAPQSGWVVFAINDKDFGNNRGGFDFELKVEPAPEALAEPGAVFACEEGEL